MSAMPQDRALIFEDPNGTRLLYDPGRTVAGANDPRLGKVDVKITINARGEVSAAMKFDNPQAAAELKGRAAEA